MKPSEHIRKIYIELAAKDGMDADLPVDIKHLSQVWRQLEAITKYLDSQAKDDPQEA